MVRIPMLVAAVLFAPYLLAAQLEPSDMNPFPRISVSLPAELFSEPLDGRVLVMFSTNGEAEPRFQIGDGQSTQQIFGVDIEAIRPGERIMIDGDDLGYPIRSLRDVPSGEYWVQAVLHRYETFHRSDGHVVKLPMDRGEGQHWNRAPGNLYSTPKKLRLGSKSAEAIRISLDREIPPITRP